MRSARHAARLAMPPPRKRASARSKAVRLVRMELQARIQTFHADLQVDFLDAFLLSAVGSQRAMLASRLQVASPELRDLLRTSLVCHNRDSGRLVVEDVRLSTHDVVYQAIDQAVRMDAACKVFPNPAQSVLAQGSRLLNPNLSKGALSGGRARTTNDVFSEFPNTTLNLLSTPSMQQLHAAVGDGLFHHLLLYTATLILLPNTCFLQITGPILSNLLQQHKPSRKQRAGPVLPVPILLRPKPRPHPPALATSLRAAAPPTPHAPPQCPHDTAAGQVGAAGRGGSEAMQTGEEAAPGTQQQSDTAAAAESSAPPLARARDGTQQRPGYAVRMRGKVLVAGRVVRRRRRRSGGGGGAVNGGGGG